SERTDLFSLGCVLYRLLSGAKPFGEGGTMVVVWAVQLKDPKPLCQVSPSVPPALSELVSRLLAKEPEDRPATAREVADELERSARGPEAPAPVLLPPLRAAWLAAGSVLALALLGGAYLLWRGPAPPDKQDGGLEASGKPREPLPAKHTLNGGG